MKRILSVLRRPFVIFAVHAVYAFGCLCYDKRYLTGRWFDRRHFTRGWQWILQCWFSQKIMGRDRRVPWPVPPYVTVSHPEHILFDPNDMDNFFSVGDYYQGIGATVTLGSGTQIAPGCGFITANHSLSDITSSQPGEPIVLGEKCLISMNSVILPGVHLGPHTVVGANSVVNESFPEGWCVIAGAPARKVKDLPRGID